jgi:hypothetical protein
VEVIQDLFSFITFPVVHGKRSVRELGRGGERQTYLKTTTGAEAAISLALATAIATDSGLEEEAMPISATDALYLYSRRGATGGVRRRAACATDDRVALERLPT